MKTDAKSNSQMRGNYDFSKGTRGKYARRYSAGTNIVLLDPDVSKMFPDSESVNSALRVCASTGTPTRKRTNAKNVTAKSKLKTAAAKKASSKAKT